MALFSCQIDYSPAECDKSSPMLLETFLNKLKERWVECTTYTRCSQKFNIGQSLIPPIMAPSIRGSDVLNTEAQKRSVVLKSMNNKCQGVYFFLSLSIVYQYFENSTSYFNRLYCCHTLFSTQSVFLKFFRCSYTTKRKFIPLIV